MKSSDEKVLQADLNLENSEVVVIIDHFITQLGDTSSYDKGMGYKQTWLHRWVCLRAANVSGMFAIFSKIASTLEEYCS